MTEGRAPAALLERLVGRPPEDWLEAAQALVLRGEIAAATKVLAAAVAAQPDAPDLRHAHAGLLRQAGALAAAEAELRELLARQPGHVAAVFLLANLLQEQGRMQATASVLRALFAHARQPVEVLIRAVELLDACGRKQDAAALCDAEIAAGSADPRVHAYAGMLDVQIGAFERARERYLFALDHAPQALDWQVAGGLAAAQRYRTADHPDFARFRECLARPALGERARASVLFALGKAHDDIGDVAAAAQYFREGNRVVGATTEWSVKNWRRLIAARLAAPPLPRRSEAARDCVPVFIVGMPRSGSTLLAEWLARHPDVCHRGELEWLPFLARQVAQAGKPDVALLDRIAATYLAQLRQDDSGARWFIDKLPLNFLHLDLIAALFPNARIIHCERDGRDTALSIWTQYFAGPEQNFAYDFTHIAAVMQGCRRLLDAARKSFAPALREVRYEELARDPQACTTELAAWLGLPAFDFSERRGEAAAISTSSLWQARQPVHTRSIGRWQAYAPHLPELLQFPVG